ncbi:DUF6503 family protein [Flavobacteriaceae bacterium S0825]|uniref:DUF6503 family protein n=1 Tax=Gaetbulibacter sp. S0825 TaxID=2720084 RepID=UPI001430159C|nr:DUF6503 family protein [Gaetbulibacter sp. S0825]MCK0108407.1 DUF6503 family protein [Flavobacteriaceae bacterium S0825]NIX64043.1 hypothetical protein [Gaetbulibacter sp. S0825]
MKALFASCILITMLLSSCKEIPLTGEILLDKAIDYHDPNNNWNTFNAAFKVRMETPNSADRLSNILINLPEDLFSLTATRDTITTKYTVNKGECIIGLNDDLNIDEETAKANNLSCDRANMYKNYYTYLYGLPMKLKDPGTHIDKIVETKTFKGKEYLVLKATYDEAVGTDIWYFYFDPETYAMEIYQFFKQDDSGNQKDDTGEYILLTKEAIVNGIKMPKNRDWYYNKDDGYLGTDILE